MPTISRLRLPRPARSIRCGQPAAAEIVQIGQRVFAAGNDHGVGTVQLGGRTDDLQPHVALHAEGVEIGEIRDVRQIDHGDLHARPVAAGLIKGAALELDRIFLRQAR